MTSPARLTRGPIGTLLRFAGYALLTGLALELVAAAAQRPGAVAVLVSEDGPVELAQAVLAAVAAAVMLSVLVRGGRGYELRVLLGLACLFAGARELDGFLGTAIGPHGYKLLAAPIGAAAAFHAWRWRAVLPGQIAEFVATPPAMLVFAGALVVLVHAQVLGQKELWEGLITTADARTVKKTVEECSELTGYMLLVFAAIEIELKRTARSAS